MLRLIKNLLIGCIATIFLCVSVVSFAANELKNVKITQEINSVRITCDLNNKCHYHHSNLKNPERLVVDLDNVDSHLKISSPKPWLQPTLKTIRCSKLQEKSTRLVFELAKSRNYKITTTQDRESFQLIIDLLNDQSPVAESDNTVVLEAPSPLSLSVNLPLHEKPEFELKNVQKSKNIIIVIDPGHGGKDPGATGARGTREKDVVLKISKILQRLINEEPGYCAVLTRTTDYYIPLRKRLAIARRNHADMFVAIHADAYQHGHATGASVYALSQRGATSEAARWLAEKENESELGGLSNELADKDAILRSVLIDLSQTHTIEASLQIGEAVLNHLSRFTGLHHSRVEQAAFVVLKSPDIPSILVETGFLSNPHEENKLTDINYQRQTAFALKQGIIHYFEMNPPTRTSLFKS